MLWTEKIVWSEKNRLLRCCILIHSREIRCTKKENDMDVIIEHARADLHALQDGGVNGIIFSNEFSFPYQRTMDMVTPAAMAYVIGNLRSEIKVTIWSRMQSVMEGHVWNWRRQ